MNTVTSKSLFQLCRQHTRRFVTAITCRISRKVSVRSFVTNTDGQSREPLLFQQLNNRAAIKVVGKDAATFLQGLITNDIRHLVTDEKGAPADSIYSLLLNQQGRVLYDVLIYRPSSSSSSTTPGDSFVIECDRSLSDDVIRHLKTFRIRKKVDVLPGDEGSVVWCVFPSPADPSSTDEPRPTTPATLRERTLSISDPALKSVIAVSVDPRLRALGTRLILTAGTTPADVWPSGDISPATDHAYRVLRYRLGVVESAEELSPATSFPLECNADYLHGVSFQKGCYIGQELTARIHHTGVVRKRLLPLVLDREVVGEELTVVDANGKAVGRPRALVGRYGVGLLRLKECLAVDAALTVSGIGARTYRPYWWPLEAPKDNLAAKNQPLRSDFAS